MARRVQDFLEAEARRDFAQSVKRHTTALGIPAKRITVRDTKSRWGSCSANGALNFSWRLIMAPPFVLDYLAAHEVAHLRELNHSHRFWKLTHQLCPRTEDAEKWLKDLRGRAASVRVSGDRDGPRRGFHPEPDRYLASGGLDLWTRDKSRPTCQQDRLMSIAVL